MTTPVTSAKPTRFPPQVGPLPVAHDKRWWADWLSTVVIIVVGTLAAGYRVFGTDRDFWQYLEYFNALRSGGCAAAFELRFEPGFALLSCTLLSSDPQGGVVTDGVVFGVAAFVSLALKTTLFRRLGPSYWLAIGIYAARFYPLHEMTQVRVSIGLGFVYWAIFWCFDRDYWRAAVALLGGVLFHYSCFLTGVFAALVQATRGRSAAIFAAVTLAVTVRFLLGDAIVFATQYFVNLQMAEHTGFGAAPNVLSLGVVLDLLVLLAWASRWRQLDVIQQRFLALFGVGLTILWASVDFPVIAWRLCETTQPAICCVIARSRSRQLVLLSIATVAVNAVAYPYLFATREYFF